MPKQVCLTPRRGLCVHVTGDKRQRMYQWLYKNMVNYLNYKMLCGGSSCADYHMTFRKVIHPKKHFILRFPALEAGTFTQTTTNPSEFHTPNINITVEACNCVSASKGCQTFGDDSSTEELGPNCKRLGSILAKPEGGFRVECDNSFNGPTNARGGCDDGGNGQDISFVAFHDGFKVRLETRKTWFSSPEPAYELNAAIQHLAIADTKNCSYEDSAFQAQRCRAENSKLVDFTSNLPPWKVSFHPVDGFLYDKVATIDGEELIQALYESYKYPSPANPPASGFDPEQYPASLYASTSDVDKTTWTTSMTALWVAQANNLPLSGSPGGGGLVRIKACISRLNAGYGQDLTAIDVNAHIEVELISNGGGTVSYRTITVAESFNDYATRLTCSDQMRSGECYTSCISDCTVEKDTHRCSTTGGHVCISVWNT